MPRVLVVATSPKTRGGITSVLKAHEKGEQWKEYHCKWIVSHIDKGPFAKVCTLLWGVVEYMVLLPWAKLVHIHLSEPTSAKRKLIFFKPAKWFGKKIVVHFHAFSPKTTINGPHGDVYRYIFSNADVVVVLSNFWKEAVNKSFNLGGKVRVIYNPCTVVQDSKKYEKTNSILYAGALNIRKGYADLVKAFAKVANVHPDWNVVLAGNGEIEQAHNLALNLGINNQVKILGWVSGSQKDQAYKEAKIFCLPSYAEGFPMAVLDAWAYGLPVVTTPVGGIPDIAEDGKNLLLFSPGNIAKLADCLDLLMSNESLRDKIASESVYLASTTFNVNTVNSQLRALYKELLNL